MSERAFDAGEQHSVEKRASDIKRRTKDADDLFAEMLKLKQGRRWVWALLEHTGVFRSSYRQDALAMAFCEGERNVGLRLLADLNRLAPQAYALMQAENAPEPTTQEAP